MKVLVSAYACEPDKGSEPHVGWTWSRAIAQVVNEVHVITRANNRPPIEHALSNAPIPNLHFHYFDLPAWARFWKRGQRGVQLYYILWQYAVAGFAKRLHEVHAFDVAHHVSMAGQHYPPGVAALSIPFIWGPIGGLRAPPSLRAALHGRARLREFAHDVVIRMARWDPLVRRAFRRARIILSLPGRMTLRPPRGDVVTSGNVFIDTSRIPAATRSHKDQTGPLHLVSAFRMIFWKGADLSLEAIARLIHKGIVERWTVLGDGPELQRWESLAKDLGLTDQVDFRGWVPRSEVYRLLSEGDALLHPSFREGWGGAVLEGMAAGLPVVCLDWGGPGHIVDEASGVAVPVDQPREAIVEDLAEAIETFADVERRHRMGGAARERVEKHFSTAALEEVVREVYRGIVW